MKSNKMTPKRVADSLFASIIRTAGSCRNCGATDELQCAHVYSRIYHSIRFNEDNAICLCKSCHMFFTWRLIEWEDFIVNVIGIDKYMDLREAALDQVKLNYKALIPQLESRLQQLNNLVS